MTPENELLRELFILTAKRSLFPSPQDNTRMWEIFEELFKMTNDPKYKLKQK